ncbi:hypothetical protein L211DRAFT_853340 [Terfezia boudieri ATCC MYA-4762]|uniref:Uncharacterized protein n=1 Tax=Terfezia boudieri ATCC MYA-4762 TaxID=1051890 RepID=A0A3N4L8S6_9PEZI|nr:hypothetical protein L211DRAFT_853340 [Terfezia boudieri ATCC MYA-4762]
MAGKLDFQKTRERAGGLKYRKITKHSLKTWKVIEFEDEHQAAAKIAIYDKNPKAAELLVFRIDTTLGEPIQQVLSYQMAKRMRKDDSFTIHLLVRQWARRRLMRDSDTYKRVANQAFLKARKQISQCMLTELKIPKMLLGVVDLLRSQMRSVIE